MARTRTKGTDITDQIQNRQPRKKPSSVEFISTGSINLNLALSQQGKTGGIARGRICNLVGDGSTGKTLLALEIAFWFYKHIQKIRSKLFPRTNNTKIFYDNVEGVMDFPIEDMYGKGFVSSVDWIQSPTAQAFGRRFQREVSSLPDKTALLYIADSLDAMDPEEAVKRIEKSIKDDKPQEGSYGAEKAKFFSNSFFSDLTKRMKGKDATLICISQVRQKMNAGLFEKKVYRTGGKALDFYTHQVAWLYPSGKLKAEAHKEERVYGVNMLMNVDRNKVAKPFRSAKAILLFDYGVDDIGSMVEYIGFNTAKVGLGIMAKDKAAIISKIEEDETLYNSLVALTEEKWFKVEDAVSEKTRNRKRRW